MGKFVVMQTIEFHDKTCGPCSQAQLCFDGGYFCRLFNANLRGEGKPERCAGCRQAEEAAEKAHA